MPRFRKKPVVIEAEQFDGTKECAERLGFHYIPDIHVSEDGSWSSALGSMMIPTLEGAHVASAGDWIITGVKGERYPCKPDIFAETYEPA